MALDKPYSAVVTRHNLCIVTSLFKNLASKVVPRDITALVLCVVVAIFITLNHIYKQKSSIKGISWRSNLVMYHAQGIDLVTHIEHGLDKNIAIFAKYPSNTNNEVLFQGFWYGQLAF